MQETSANNKRIAKNTLLLYIRMLLLMLIGLYTSRVVLNALGVEDYGIYNVVGGLVALFSILTGSLSSASSRFLVYELGKYNNRHLTDVFSSILFIHLFQAVILLILAEIIGIWFLNEKMVIPVDRIAAANWVFHLSVLSLFFSVITVPYNAAIIAHEKMSAFTYISIYEGCGKLLACFALLISPIDQLVFYAFLLLCIQVSTRLLFFLYSRKHFAECSVRWHVDKKHVKEILSYTGWTMIGSSSAVLKSQGGNVLINLFGGPVVNAARSISNQVLYAVNGFVTNFITALTPQITKTYAKGDLEYMKTLVAYGSRFSYYMLLLLCLPILMNTHFILNIWLVQIPEHTVCFVQLTLCLALIDSISFPLITAQQATGNVRNYQIAVGSLQLMNLPVSYIFLKLGGGPETILYVAIFFSLCCLATRIYMLRNSVQLETSLFLKRVIVNILFVTISSAIVPSFMMIHLDESWSSFISITFLCFLFSLLSILFIGCHRDERQFVFDKISFVVSKILRKKHDSD